MNYAPYPRYKDTDIDWIPRAPAHWLVSSLRRFLTVRSGDMVSAMEFQEDGYPVFGGNGFRGHLDRWNTERETIIVGRYGALCGNVRVTEQRIWATEHAFRVIPLQSFNPYFFAYLIDAIDLNRLSARTAQPGLNSELVRDNPCVVPPPDEQRAIVAFLDRETARIDALIEKKRRLLELLEEKRLATITQAVTQGLDPDVPLKDSGVEWLGEVPAHWEVKQLKWAIMFQRGHDLPAHEREEGQVPVVSSAGVSSTHAIAAAKAPGIVTGRYGTIGRFDLIAEDYWPLNTTLYSIDLYENDPHFLRYMLTNLSPLFELNAVKSAVPGVDRNDIHTTMTAVAPFEEQRMISVFLDREIGIIARLMAKVREAIGCLGEYRSALITNAVTGQLNVRGLVPTEDAA